MWAAESDVTDFQRSWCFLLSVTLRVFGLQPQQKSASFSLTSHKIPFQGLGSNALADLIQTKALATMSVSYDKSASLPDSRLNRGTMSSPECGIRLEG